MKMTVIMKRELSSYFSTPIAYVFILIFLVLAGVFTFYIGNFYERMQADLIPFFSFHPWLYLFLIPAISMRMWSEERNSGTLELLLTLPVSKTEIILGKFFAAWLFSGLALILTFPIWVSVNYLGNPDNGVILASYIGSWLMAGGFLSIGSCMSALTRNQVVAFVLCGFITLLFIMAGFPLVLDLFRGWVPLLILDAITSLSFLTHYNSITKGVLSLNDFLYFISIIVAWLFATAIAIESKKS